MLKTILVTGGAGFIGGNFILRWMREQSSAIVSLDNLTYAGNPETLAPVQGDPRYTFVHGDIRNGELLRELFQRYRFAAVVHFAAESHVDRSILEPAAFLTENIQGRFELMQAARVHLAQLSGKEQSRFRFLHVSTDEVFGTLYPAAPAFEETTAYAPNSPYAASKAASDHLVRAWHHTYGLPTLITNCSNNYGPFQFPEKLIPLIIHQALQGKLLPVYGDGQQVRDWLYVEDHCRAIEQVLAHGRPGETYNIGGLSERTNLEVVRAVCMILDQLLPDSPQVPHEALIQMVRDRPGHDRRYAINAEKIGRELGWAPRESFETGLRKTVEWYLSNAAWTESVTSGAYRNWLVTNYIGRADLRTGVL